MTAMEAAEPGRPRTAAPDVSAAVAEATALVARLTGTDAETGGRPAEVPSTT
jgi:hypothetical protein